MATSIEVDNFITPHGKGEGGGGGTTIVMGGKNNSVPANLNVNTINATTGNIQNLTGRSMTFNDASFIYLVSENGTIAKLNGNDLKYENGSIKSITSDSIDTGKLKTTDLEATNATIDNIISKNITTENLTVTKQAHFFELVIDKIKSVGGQIILTPASCIADYVITGPEGTIGYDENEEAITGPLYYDVYFRATDEVNREITNDWRVDDQAICQNFNNAGIGHSYNVSNKYYWRLVTGILDDVYINFRTGQKLPYNTTDAHDYTSANIWNICLGANDVNTGNHIDYKTEFGSEPGGDPYYPADPDTEGYTKRSLLDNVDIAPMKLNGLPMAGWTDKTEPEDEDEVPMVGEMKTYNTIFGIQITPKEGYQLDGALLNNIELSTAEETRLNIGVYYVDGSSQYFPASLEKTRHYVYELNANTNVEAIMITNSDEPDWHLCHGIQLGNDNSNPNDLQVDVKYNPYSATVPSIPEAGDNIIQLGYRYNKYSPGQPEYSDVKRASAIIIASYHTPDTGINPPSYAQYKKITEFKLAKYRHTYFDADKAAFYGNFYIGPDDSDPDDYVPISDLEAEVYKIVPSDDVITKDINDKITPPTLTCSFMVPNQSELVNVVPPGCVFNYWKDNGNVVSISAGNAVSITLWDQNDSTVNLQNKIILQLAKLTGDSGQQGPQGSQGVQTQKILDQILKPVVEIDVANGQDGLPGNFTEWVYRNGVNGENLPTNDRAFVELDNDWSKTATTPPDGQFTWCTSRDNEWIRTVNGPAIDYGDWQTAYRITGNNGKNGEDGDPGTAGANGKYIEFIYKHTTVGTSFTGQNNPKNWDNNSNADKNGNTFDDPDYLGPENAGWEDNPQGLGTIDNVFYEFEYMSQREFNGEHFEPFTEPVIWSRWGQNGQDGDGYEYVYTLSDEEPDSPNDISYGEIEPEGVADGRITNKNQDEWVPNGWTDEPQGVSSTAGETKEWVSMRKKSGANRDWGPFSYPALWAQYVPKGTNGGRYYFLYANYGSTGQPSIIPNGSARYSVSQLTNARWSLSSTTPDYANNKYTYMTQAFFNDGDTTSIWSVPARITGDNGQKGEDGSFTEFIYTRNSTGVAPSAPTGTYPRDWPNNGSTDHQTVSGVTWYDNPQGVTENVMYEYISSREYNGATGNWTPYSPPAIWSKWGEKGEDGDGYEYVFLLWMSATAPTIYSNDTYKGKAKTDDGYLPYSLDPSNNKSRWSDNPVSPTSSTRYVYVSMRKKTTDDSGNSAWGNFSPAKLWTKYTQDGATGPTGPQGSQGSSGQNGTNGTNGVSPIEYKLMDLGSSASVKMSLNESNNQINQTMSVKLKFRILKCEGSVSRYLYSSEIGNKRVYYRMSQQQDGTTYRYKPLSINTSGTYVQFTIDYNTSYKRIIDDNYNITVSLIGNAINSNGQIIDPIEDTQITSYPIFDTTNISVTLESGAAINIVQKDVNGLASISSLVTGPQGISQIWQSMSGIQSSVSTVQNNVNNINNNLNNNYATKTYVTSQINQEAGVIESSVKESIKGGGGYNLIMNGNYSFGTISPTAKYWENWNYSYNGTTYTPTSRFIYTDNNNYRWLTVKSKYKWQGYMQSHYNDHGITINGGQTYTLSFRAYVVEDSYNPKTGEYSPSAKLQICFHWHNDTSTYQQYYSKSIPQINRYIDIDKTDRLYYVTFDAKQYDSFTNGSSNLYVNNGYSWVSTGEPAKWFEFMIGSGLGDYNNPVTQYFRITDITLTPGSIAQGWTPSTVEQDIKTESKITQSANSITTSVNDLSTRLDTGGFTINANTTINGQLTINNSSEKGFIVTGDNGNTSILSKSIGLYNNFKNAATPWIIITGRYGDENNDDAYWSTTSNSYTTENNIGLGNIKSNTTISFKGFSCSAHKPNSGYSYAVEGWSGTIQIYNGNNKVHEFTSINSSSTQKSYTTTSEGTYSLKLTWKITSLSWNGQSVSSATIEPSFSMYVFIPNGTYTLIGYDGIASNFGNSNTVFFGNEGTYIRYTDDNVLRVSNEGIQKYNNKYTSVGGTDYYSTQYWSPINGCSVRNVSSGNYTLTKYDDMIVANPGSGNRTNIYLGNPNSSENKGRKVYIKQMSGTVYVYGRLSNEATTVKRIIPNNDTTAVESREQDKHTRIYISDGRSYWYEGWF